MNAHTISVGTHGRYLVDLPTHGAADGVIVACHGYGENAAIQMERLQAMPADLSWLRVSVQGLHRFYRGRSSDIAASWMTSEDRELMIGDNVAYLQAVVDQVMSEHSTGSLLVFAGFSQGVGMAFRAACGSTRPVTAVVAIGGDVPPELTHERLERIPRVLYGRGKHDSGYPAHQFTADQSRLQHAGVMVTPHVLDEDHAWSPAFSAVVGDFLRGLTPQRG